MFEPKLIGGDSHESSINHISTEFQLKTCIKMKRLSLLLALIVCFATTVVAQWQESEGIYGGAINCSVVNGSDLFVVHQTDAFTRWRRVLVNAIPF
jgi:hypothetical protein